MRHATQGDKVVVVWQIVGSLLGAIMQPHISAQMCEAASEHWACEVDVIAALPKEEQRAVLKGLFLAMGKVTGEALGKSSSDADRCWAVGVGAFGSRLIASAASKNEDIGDGLNKLANVSWRLIDGLASPDDADNAHSEALAVFQTIPLDLDATWRVAQRTTQLDGFERALVSSAQFAASSHCEDRR